MLSEKAISTASGNIVDEALAKPSLNARFIARHWMRTVWGHLLVRLCHFRESMSRNLREYPLEMGDRHKQVVLQRGGLLQALMFGSECGIDGSNLAYAYVSLPLKNPQQTAQRIREEILRELCKRVCVVITDTDKTYSIGNFHFTPRPTSIEGIHCFGGIITYVVGRTLKLRRRATPIAAAGCEMPAETALQIAQFANRARGSGAGKNIWEMAERLRTGLDSVSWEMLETVKHKPIVIVRPEKEPSRLGTRC